MAKASKKIRAVVGDSTPLPEASGTFAYAQWLAHHKLSGEELQALGQRELRVGSV